VAGDRNQHARIHHNGGSERGQLADPDSGAEAHPGEAVGDLVPTDV